MGSEWRHRWGRELAVVCIFSRRILGAVEGSLPLLLFSDPGVPAGHGSTGVECLTVERREEVCLNPHPYHLPLGQPCLSSPLLSPPFPWGTVGEHDSMSPETLKDRRTLEVDRESSHILSAGVIVCPTATNLGQAQGHLARQGRVTLSLFHPLCPREQRNCMLYDLGPTCWSSASRQDSLALSHRETVTAEPVL